MKKFKSIIVIVLMLVLSAAIVGCTTNSNESSDRINNAYITLDINPSIEIITGEEGLVVQVNALNDDAQVLLIDTSFTGKTVDETIEAILQLATDMGYIDSELENAILITAETDTPEDTVQLEDTIAQKVAKFVEDRKIKLDLIKASFEATEDIKAQAEELGVSVGKVKLITYALAFDDSLTLEAAAEMPVRDLNKIVINGRKEVKEFYSEEVRSKYFELKDEAKVNHKLKVIELINNHVQNAEDDKFAQVLADSVATVADVKALYQAYYDEIVNLEIPTEEEIEADNQEIIDQIKAIEVQLEELKDELKVLYKSIRDSKLTKEELTTLFDEIKEKVLLERELNKQLRDLSKTIKGNGFNKPIKDRPVKGRHMMMFAKNCGFEKQVDINSYYKEVTKKYQREFSEINVDMHELENIFAEELKADFDLLEAEKELAIKTIMNELHTQSKIIKEEMVEENKVLKDVWKNNKKHR